MKDHNRRIKTIVVSFNILGLAAFIAGGIYSLYHKNDPAARHSMGGALVITGFILITIGNLIQLFDRYKQGNLL